ncbi:hypothetical protein I308_101000 [Cryptococcus tetragattii IND107]|uniref:Uncharacterized protein n=1 Tax=Cryptococcus tetragattii IND107 TaxID=1296105 RepID=A0ABR3BZ32_9TREE
MTEQIFPSAFSVLISSLPTEDGTTTLSDMILLGMMTRPRSTFPYRIRPPRTTFYASGQSGTLSKQVSPFSRQCEVRGTVDHPVEQQTPAHPPVHKPYRTDVCVIATLPSPSKVWITYHTK